MTQRDLPKRDIPLLVLATLADGALHGYAIARAVEAVSRESVLLREGTLYPVLRLLESDGMIAGDWQIQERGPARKVYTLTEKGGEELARRTRDWQEYSTFMNAMLGGKRHEEQPA
jgi:PadR family transcriptional regulator PadR